MEEYVSRHPFSGAKWINCLVANLIEKHSFQKTEHKRMNLTSTHDLNTDNQTDEGHLQVDLYHSLGYI